MDDHAHTEFTPRQRHTLKEFAAIVMREMELWKDKIQLQIRDRIQNSMEQFTRECLEIDTEAETNSTHSMLKMASMDKVYERAAKLVKRTLDVEGAVVMDVSHFDVLETTKAEGAISIVCHHGDATVGTTTHSIPTDEYPAFMEFFSKHPEGKIAEYFVPKCFRSLLPSRIQHALSQLILLYAILLSDLPFISCPDLQYRQTALRFTMRIQYHRSCQTFRMFGFHTLQETQANSNVA